jgi:hypothetical protein
METFDVDALVAEATKNSSGALPKGVAISSGTMAETKSKSGLI